jgi:hypothetical protein
MDILLLHILYGDNGRMIDQWWSIGNYLEGTRSWPNLGNIPAFAWSQCDTLCQTFKQVCEHSEHSPMPTGIPTEVMHTYCHTSSSYSAVKSLGQYPACIGFQGLTAVTEEY